MSLTTPMNRFTVHNTSIGPIERWPYYYSGESCVYAVVGYTDLNYAPWCIGAEHIIESKTNIDGVLFISDPDFPLIFRFTEDGLTYLSGRGKAILRSGEALLFNPTDDASEWTDLLQSSNVLQRRG
ncbi:MAG: hypothetical protein ACE5HI_07540, partial [bacterium]